MRVIICGGGTAGHVTPGIAIAEYIKKHSRHSDILFVGRDGGEENSLIKRSGFNLATVDVQGFKRSLSLKNATALMKVLIALRKAGRILKDFQPNAVIGTGGYVCWPIIKAAQHAKIPTLLHESNAYPGLTTRTLSGGCDRVLVNYEECKRHLKRQDNTLAVGNPVRSEFMIGSRSAARKRLNISPSEIFILSFGGSGGSDVMNECILSVMKAYSKQNKRIQHLHATGHRYFENAKENFPEIIGESARCRAVPFINDMPTYMLACDIVISRAGAMTLSEISQASVCPIIIPSPNVTDDHQRKNAKVYEAAGAGVIIDESELTPERLREEIERLVSQRNAREEIAKRAHSFSIGDSAKIIFEEIEKLIEKRLQK